MSLKNRRPDRMEIWQAMDYAAPLECLRTTGQGVLVELGSFIS